MVMVLGILQPANALFRPHATPEGQKPELKRRLWEVGHKSSGYFAVLLAFAAIYTGAMLGYSPIAEYDRWAVRLLGLLLELGVARWLRAMYFRCSHKKTLSTRG